MGATSWSEQSTDQTGWDSNLYPPGTQFVVIGEIVMPVDADGNPVAVIEPTTWTEQTVSAPSYTEVSISATSWTEGTL